MKNKAEATYDLEQFLEEKPEYVELCAELKAFEFSDAAAVGILWNLASKNFKRLKDIKKIPPRDLWFTRRIGRRTMIKLIELKLMPIEAMLVKY